MLLARTDGTWISFQTWHYAVFCPRTLEIWDVLGLNDSLGLMGKIGMKAPEWVESLSKESKTF